MALICGVVGHNQIDDIKNIYEKDKDSFIKLEIEREGFFIKKQYYIYTSI